MILPVAPANIKDMHMRKPVLMPRLMMLPIIYIRKDTATRRKEVRKILSTSSMPKAMPLFSVKRILNHGVISITSCMYMFVLTKILMIWSMIIAASVMLAAITICFRCFVIRKSYTFSTAMASPENLTSVANT